MSRNRKKSDWSPPPPWVPLPLDVMESPAWNQLSRDPSALRLVLFLVREWARHKGQKNGSLVAPRRQLEDAGIHPSRVSAAIVAAERLGLVDVTRGKGRAANQYALTWLPLKGESEPTNRWRQHQLGNNRWTNSASESCATAESVSLPTR